MRHAKRKRLDETKLSTTETRSLFVYTSHNEAPCYPILTRALILVTSIPRTDPSISSSYSAATARQAVFSFSDAGRPGKLPAGPGSSSPGYGSRDLYMAAVDEPWRWPGYGQLGRLDRSSTRSAPARPPRKVPSYSKAPEVSVG